MTSKCGVHLSHVQPTIMDSQDLPPYIALITFSTHQSHITRKLLASNMCRLDQTVCCTLFRNIKYHVTRSVEPCQIVKDSENRGGLLECGNLDTHVTDHRSSGNNSDKDGMTNIPIEGCEICRELGRNHIDQWEEILDRNENPKDPYTCHCLLSDEEIARNTRLSENGRWIEIIGQQAPNNPFSALPQSRSPVVGLSSYLNCFGYRQKGNPGSISVNRWSLICILCRIQQAWSSKH